MMSYEVYEIVWFGYQNHRLHPLYTARNHQIAFHIRAKVMSSLLEGAQEEWFVK